MPIYEYKCQECNCLFEQLVDAATIPECPECRGHKLHKQFSTFAPSGGSKGGGDSDALSCPTCGIPGGSCGMN